MAVFYAHRSGPSSFQGHQFLESRFWTRSCPCDLKIVICAIYDLNQVRAESAMPSSARIEGMIWWLTVSNIEDRWRIMKMDEWDKALATWRGSVTWRKAVTVE